MPFPRRAGAALAICLLLGLLAWRLAPPATARRGPAAAAPQRIVSLSPAFTEMVYAVGAGDCLVGVSDFCHWPPAVEHLPRCGGLVNPSLERLTALRPDLILVQDELAHLTEQLGDSRLRTWGRPLDSLAQIEQALADLGVVLGRPDGGRQAAARLHGELEAVQLSVAGQTVVKTFICLGRQPDRIAGLTTCGATWLDDLLQVAGGRNLYHDSPRQYPTPGAEDLTARQPEAILDIQPGLSGAAVRQVAQDWAALSSVPAVKQGRVVVLTDDDTLIPGPRLGGVARRLAAYLHPATRGGARRPSPG